MRSTIVFIAVVLAGCANPAPSLQSLPVASVSDCGGTAVDQIEALDVAIAIDSSSSTRLPSDADVDGDGNIGRLVNSVVTDTDDSLLAAQVAEVRSLVRAAAPLGVRFSIVTYSGPYDFPVGLPVYAIVQSELTADVAELENGLDSALKRGSGGTTDFAGAMRRALQTLIDTPPESPSTRRLILFLSDSPHPVLPQPYPLVRYPNHDPRMRSAAIRAIQTRVQIHTFALGAAVHADSPNALTRIAGATGGTYFPIERTDRLHCDLFAALAASPTR